MWAFPALVGGLAAPPPPVEAQEAGADTLRVLVYNIHAGRGPDGRDNLGEVADLIDDHRVHVALLQEVDRRTERSGDVDQPGRLGWLTALYDTFGKTLDYQGGEYGLTTLTWRPATERALQPLPVEVQPERAGASLEPRGALHVAVSATSGTLHLVNTHLDPGSPEVRGQEVEALLAHADALRATGRPVLIGGDFNAEPDAPAIMAVRAAGWVDVWEACGSGAGFTYPAAEPTGRIDYLFVAGEVSCLEARVLPSEASDHRPLLVSLIVAGR